MKVKFFVITIALMSALNAKITKRKRDSVEKDRELMDMGINGSAEQLLDASDSTAIDNAAARMASLVDRVNRLKTKLQRELQTTVSYLRYHFNQRDVFDKRVMMQHLSAISAGQKVGGGDRMLLDQPMLKDYGKIESEVKKENFENIKVPQDTDNIVNRDKNKK